MATPSWRPANAVVRSVTSSHRQTDDGTGIQPSSSVTAMSASAQVSSRSSTYTNGSIENVPRSTSTMPSSFMIAQVSPSGTPIGVQ